MSQSLVGIVIIEHRRFTYSNAKFDEMFGYRNDEVAKLRVIDVVAEDDHALVAENLRKRDDGEVERLEYIFRGRRKDGRAERRVPQQRDAGGRRRPHRQPRHGHHRARRAERKVRALQDKLREQSTHDALTGLYNRRFLDEAIGMSWPRPKRSGTR